MSNAVRWRTGGRGLVVARWNRAAEDSAWQGGHRESPFVPRWPHASGAGWLGVSPVLRVHSAPALPALGIATLIPGLKDVQVIGRSPGVTQRGCLRFELGDDGGQRRLLLTDDA